MNNNAKLRSKMKDIGFRLIDLADFLEISRPTAYKFIEMYEMGQVDGLDWKIKNLFDFIVNDDVFSKASVIDYVIQNIIKPQKQTSEYKKQIISNLLNKENEIKKEFISIVAESDTFNPILQYLIDCEKVIQKIKNDKSGSKDKSKDLEILSQLKSFYESLGYKLL